MIFTIFVDFLNDFLQSLFTEFVTQHGQYRPHHVCADAALLVVVEGIESFLQNCNGTMLVRMDDY